MTFRVYNNKKKEAASTMMKMLFAAKTKAKVNIRSGSAKLDKFLRALCVGFQLIPALRILRWLGIALETFFFRLFLRALSLLLWFTVPASTLNQY